MISKSGTTLETALAFRILRRELEERHGDEAGRYIIATGRIPRQDIFSYTLPGQRWVTHEWLAELIIFGLYRLGGLSALLLATSALITAAFGLVAGVALAFITTKHMSMMITSFVGALLLVSGGIFNHNLEFMHHLLEGIPSLLKDFLVGLVVGSVAVLGLGFLNEWIDYLSQPSLQDLIELVEGEIDPMFGHPVLRKIIGSDLFGPVPFPHLRFSIAGDIVLLFLQFMVIEPGFEYFHGQVAVAVLGFAAANRLKLLFWGGGTHQSIGYPVTPDIVLYLENPPDAAQISGLLKKLGMSAGELVRRGESDYKACGLGRDSSDEDILAAIARNTSGLETLSVERIGIEMLKLLSAPNPAPAKYFHPGTSPPKMPVITLANACP